MEGPTLFDLQAVRNLDVIDFRELGLAQPKTPNEFAAAAFRALKTHSEGAHPVDTIVSGHLYLGSIVCARNHAFLASAGVTDVLVMTTVEDQNAGDFKDSTIRFWRLDLPDCLGYPVIAELRAALHLVEDKVFDSATLPSFTMADVGGVRRVQASNNRTLFVHCQQGISRSTTFVVLYLLYRLYIQLPEDSDADDVPDPGDIIARVLQKRQVAPNTSFRTQLQLIAECLKAIINDSIFNDIENIQKRRQIQFDFVLRYLESYLETGSRAIAETVAYMRHQLLQSLQQNAAQTLSLGLTAWAMKQSAARNSSVWLKRGVLLENFMIYVQQPPSYLSVVTMGHDKDEFGTYAESEARVNARWKGEKSEFFKLPQFAEVADPLGNGANSGQARYIVDIPAASARHLTALEMPDTCRTLPQYLFFQIEDASERYKRIRESMGLQVRSRVTSPSVAPECPNFSPSTSPRRMLPPWNAQSLLNGLASTAADTSAILNQLLQRFECKNWAMWAVHRVLIQCNKFSDAFKRYARSNAVQGARPATTTDSTWSPIRSAGWIAAPRASTVSGLESSSQRKKLSEKSIPRDSDDSERPSVSRKGVRRGHEDRACETERKKRRRLRYEDVDIPFLQREIERTEQTIQSLKRRVNL